MTDNLDPFKIGCSVCGCLEFTITQSKKFKEVALNCSNPVRIQTCNGCGRIIRTQVNHDPCQTDDLVKIYTKLCNTEDEYEIVSIPQRQKKTKALQG